MWKDVLSDYLNSKEYKKLEQKVCEEYKTNLIFPPKQKIFTALKLTEYEDVKCVILGQDPYHNDNQAMGLSFSVSPGVQIPPSLKNIFKELDLEYGCGVPDGGDLTVWANQGVLMLNSILTVRAHQAASHRGIGWEQFTDEILKSINKKKEPVVYMLWGNYAKEKVKLLDNPNHLVLTSAHPSPLSCRNFFGNNHFKRCNQFLKEHGTAPIDWVHDLF